MLLLGMFAMYSFLSPTLYQEPEIPYQRETVDGQKLTREGYPAIPDNTEVLWWDWKINYPPMKKTFLVKGELTRDSFLCTRPLECDEERGTLMETWEIVSKDNKSTPEKKIYLGVTSWAVIYSSLPVERKYPIANFWGHNLRKIANNGKEYLFFVSYNKPENWEFRSDNSMVEDRRIVAGQ